MPALDGAMAAAAASVMALFVPTYLSHPHSHAHMPAAINAQSKPGFISIWYWF